MPNWVYLAHKRLRFGLALTLFYPLFPLVFDTLFRKILHLQEYLNDPLFAGESVGKQRKPHDVARLVFRYFVLQTLVCKKSYRQNLPCG